MKICAVICEYNPFHNGHLWHLEQAKKRTGADAVLCIMSGNFVQRGEAAIAEKHTRAKHALQAGADAVIELPVPFATANAELFAKGAVHILASIPAVKYLCFGAENADALAFVSAARILNDEPQEVKEKLRKLLGEGVSFARAREQAFAGFIPTDLLLSPNNVLGLEYTRAILNANADIAICPIERTGNAYHEKTLCSEFPSASAIRTALAENTDISGYVPDFVRAELFYKESIPSRLAVLEKHALLSETAETIASTCDCTEGLENAFKRVAESVEELETLVSARYTASRIRRIALQNLLQIRKNLILESLQSPLYLRILAANRERRDVLTALGESSFPIIARAHDETQLTGVALSCFERDIYAEKIYALLTQTPKKTTNIFI